jgi:tripartite-type tricarboxylate transporter receptor subunit TctC
MARGWATIPEGETNVKNWIAFGALAVATLAGAQTQDWPRKPVRVIVPFPAASTPDTLARTVTDRLSAQLKQPFVVENRPGAGGMIGTDAVAKAAPDGYTIGVSITGPLVNNTLLYKSMAYDPFRDLAPITLAVNQPCVLVVNKDFPAANVPEVIAELQRNAGKYNYASLGNGTVAHLSMELVAAKSATQVVHVPYAGSAQAVAAIVAGDASLGCMPAISVMPLVRAGRLKAIGAASRTRNPLLPDLPTLGEQGLEIEANAWIGFIAPAKTPPALLARLHDEIAGVLREPEVRKALAGQLMEPVGNTPSEFSAYMKEELARWGPIIRANRITLD